MKKLLTNFRAGYFVLFALLALTACERDDAIEEVDNDLRLETVSIAEARKAIEASLLQTKAKNNKFDLVLDWDNAGQENLINSDAKMTVVPAFTSNNNGYNRVLFLKIEGVVEEALFTMYKTEEDPEGFTGYIFIRKINRKFVCSLKIEKGMIVAIMRKKQLTTKSSKEDTCDCDCENGCVDCDDEIHDWGAGCDEEVVITATHRKNLNVRFIFPRVMDVREHSAPDEGGSSYNYGGGSPSNSALSPLPKVDFKDNIHDEDLNDCLKAILSDLKNANMADLKKIIENSMSAKVPKGYEWTLGMDASKISPRANASTGWGSGKIVTNFDWSKLRNATDLSIARTIIHEAVHAFLLNEFRKTNTARQNYPQLVESWNKFGETKLAHHAEMGANFIDEIARGLKAYGKSRGYNYSDQFYEDLSWGGLRYYNGNRKRPTEIYTATVTSQADKDRIESVIANEFKRGKNSKGGKPCE